MTKAARIMCLTLCILLTIAMVSACSSGNEKQTTSGSVPPTDSSWQTATEGSGGIALPIFREKKKMTFMVYEVAANPYKEGFIVLDELAKRINAEFEFLPSPVEGFPEKLNVMLMADDYPEIIGGMDFSAIVEQGLQGGKFLNAYEYLDDMPNFKKTLERIPALNEYKASADAMYSLPACIYSEASPESLLQYSFLTRKDLVEKHGLKLPNTYDELYDFLKQLKQLYPESEPWTDRTGILGLINKVSPGWGINSEFGKFKYNEADKSFSLTLDDPKYKEVVEYLRKLYTEVLLDQEFILMSVEQWMAKLVNGTAFFACDWFSRAQVITEAARANGDNELLMNVIMPPANPGFQQVVQSGKLARTFIAASSKVDYPHEIMKLLDYFYYSKDGAILNQLGVEGVSFKWVDEAKTKWEHIKADDISDNRDRRQYQLKYGLGMDLMIGLRVEDFGLEQADKGEDIYNYDSLKGHTILPPPTMVFNSDEVERLQELGSFDTFVDYELSKYIIGENDMSTWEDFIKQAGEEYGGHEQVKVYNESWARRN